MILIDAGPLIALCDADDALHGACMAASKKITEPVGTIWPVLAEAMYILGDVPGAQAALWELLIRGAVDILPLNIGDAPRIRELMRKYSDIGMDMADAALIAVAERERLNRFFTTDRRDFSVYRLHGRPAPRILSL